MGFFKKAGSRLFDVRLDKWVGADNIKDNFQRTTTIVKDITKVEQAQRVETYEEALVRLELTEADIQQRQQEFTRLLYVYLTMAFLVFLYGLFRFLSGQWLAGTIACAIMLFPLSQAFRFHFWLFQIKHKRLGCTFQVWFNTTFRHMPLPELPVNKGVLTDTQIETAQAEMEKKVNLDEAMSTAEQGKDT